MTESEPLLFDCSNWAVSASWRIPEDAVSGVYIARLVRHDGEENWRADNSQGEADIRFGFKEDIGKAPSKPIPGPHAYGANGHGELENSIYEPKASHVYFVVRQAKGKKSDIIVQTSDTTWQAYNNYGGTTLYGDLSGRNKTTPRSFKASYNRPFMTRKHRAANILWGSEYPMIRFLESNGFDVSYQSAIDTDRQDSQVLLNHKLFVSSGHDEYWSGP